MILRTLKSSCYTVIDNCVFKDRTLSYRAKGLLCTMLSLPDGWDFNIEGLATLSSDGTTAVKSTLKELEKAGYLMRRQIREKGKIVDTEYTIAENPVLFTDPDMIPVPHESPAVVQPQVGIPPVANRGQLNTNELSTYESNTYSNRGKGFIPPTVEEVREYCYQRQNNVDPQTFVDFYESKGWMIGKSKMKDWKAAVRTWERNRKGSQQSTGNPYIDMLKEGRF